MTGDVYAELGGHSNTKLKVNLADAFHKADSVNNAFMGVEKLFESKEMYAAFSGVYQMLFLIITLLCVMLAPKSEK
jgi:hypothetical protein